MGGGWVVTFEIRDGPLTFILIPWDLLLPSTFSSSNLLPPPSYSSHLLHPPPKPPPNSSYLLKKGLRWLISSYKKRLLCYSAQKSFMGGGDIAIIATSPRSRSLIRDLRLRLEMDLNIELKKLSSSNLLPPPSYSSQLLHTPPNPPLNSSYLLPKGLRWLISSHMKRFQCYSAQKSFMGGGGGGGIVIQAPGPGLLEIWKRPWYWNF